MTKSLSSAEASVFFFIWTGKWVERKEPGKNQNDSARAYFSFFVFFRPPPLKEPLRRRE